jgi:hypothetical protein
MSPVRECPRPALRRGPRSCSGLTSSHPGAVPLSVAPRNYGLVPARCSRGPGTGAAAAGGGRSEVKRSRAGVSHGEPRTESPLRGGGACLGLVRDGAIRDRKPWLAGGGSREAPFRYARHKPHSFSGTLLNGPLDIGMSPRFVEPPASPPGPRYWAQQPQEGGEVRLSAAVWVYRTASHERSPPSEAAEPVLVWSATGRSATGNPGSREGNVRLSPGHSFFSRRKIRSVPPLRGTPRCAPWHREERTDTLPYI